MITEEHARLHAKLRVYRHRVQQAQQIVSDALRLTANPYVACSFGKDSAALLHLVLQSRPDASVRFIRWQETNIIDDYERVIAQWQNDYGINLDILDLQRATLDESVPDRWRQLQDVQPCDGFFIGLRAEESRGRRITLRKDGVLYRAKSGLLRITPLAWWSTLDVAAYIVTHQLPTLETYASDGFAARTSSRVPRGDYGIREGMLASLKHRNPARFNALKYMMPEVSQYV